VVPGVSKHLATVGSVDEKLLAETRQARQRLINAERDAAVARAEFHRGVRRLVSRSSSPRDVAAVLGLSDQQLHEILLEADGPGGEAGGRTSQIDLSCSFCGGPQHEVRKLIAGPGAYICDACVELAGGVVRSGRPADTRLGQMRAVSEQDRQTQCSFCDKRRKQVTGLAAMSDESAGELSGSAVICVECLVLCDEIIARNWCDSASHQ
jgi:hypothetical protein